MTCRWLIAVCLGAAVAWWSWRVLNPRPALIFIAVVALILWIAAATASTFGAPQSYWVNRQTKGVPHGR